MLNSRDDSGRPSALRRNPKRKRRPDESESEEEDDESARTKQALRLLEKRSPDHKRDTRSKSGQSLDTPVARQNMGSAQSQGRLSGVVSWDKPSAKDLDDESARSDSPLSDLEDDDEILDALRETPLYPKTGQPGEPARSQDTRLNGAGPQTVSTATTSHSTQPEHIPAEPQPSSSATSTAPMAGPSGAPPGPTGGASVSPRASQEGAAEELAVLQGPFDREVARRMLHGLVEELYTDSSRSIVQKEREHHEVTDALRAELQLAQAEVAEYKQRLEETRARAVQLRAEDEARQLRSIDAIRQEKARLATELADAKAESRSLREAFDKVQVENHSLTEELRTSKDNMEKLQAEVKWLRFMNDGRDSRSASANKDAP